MSRKRGEAGSSPHGLTESLASLCPQALLLLGLNPISASFQDQHCESLSLVSNVSGESPSPCHARFQVSTAPSSAHRALPQDRKSREISLPEPHAAHHPSVENCAQEGPEVGGKESCCAVPASAVGRAMGESPQPLL